MTDPAPLLSVRNLCTCYGHIEALKGISLEVFPGEIVTLIGSNGAGKSTTLRSISGMVRPRSGEILFRGQAIQHLKPYEVAALGLGHVPEGRRIFPQLTVEENLDIGAYLERSPAVIAQRKGEVFALFPRLAERRRQAGGTLSGGEQQMLAIGRALMSRPRLLLLDEPSMGLAPLLVNQIFETILDINEQGTTILLVEQNAHMALSIADRGYVLETGEVVLAGQAEEVIDNDEVRCAYLGE